MNLSQPHNLCWRTYETVSQALGKCSPPQSRPSPLSPRTQRRSPLMGPTTFKDCRHQGYKSNSKTLYSPELHPPTHVSSSHLEAQLLNNLQVLLEFFFDPKITI